MEKLKFLPEIENLKNISDLINILGTYYDKHAFAVSIFQLNNFNKRKQEYIEILIKETKLSWNEKLS